MNNFCIVLWTARDIDEAKKVAKLLLENKMIACATLLDGAHSMYIWNGRVEFEKEVQLIMKSVKSNFSKIKATIQANCSYKVPEILEIEIQNGLEDYLNWIKQAVF